jgi:hypothetical protein
MCSGGTAANTPVQWADVVRYDNRLDRTMAASFRVAWHNDLTVNVANLNETNGQWANFQGADQTADISDTAAGYPT